MIRNDRIWLRRVLLIGCLLVALIHLLLLAWQTHTQSTVVAEGLAPVAPHTESTFFSGGFQGPQKLRLFRSPGRSR